jgi:predicted Fe-Mo cluster-binding NifX family protein
MKVAVSSTGTELSSQVNPRFGRAEYLLVIDTETQAIVEAIDNREAGGMAQGAGINAASRIADAGVRAVITGAVGPKAAVVCEKSGIIMVNGVNGTVAEAVQKFLADSQVSSTEPVKPSGISAPAGPGQGADCRRGGQGRGCGKGPGRGGGRGQGQGGRGQGQGGGRGQGRGGSR